MRENSQNRTRNNTQSMNQIKVIKETSSAYIKGLLELISILFKFFYCTCKFYFVFCISNMMILILNDDWINNYMNELITIWKK